VEGGEGKREKSNEAPANQAQRRDQGIGLKKDSANKEGDRRREGGDRHLNNRGISKRQAGVQARRITKRKERGGGERRETRSATFDRKKRVITLIYNRRFEEGRAA